MGEHLGGHQAEEEEVEAEESHATCHGRAGERWTEALALQMEKTTEKHKGTPALPSLPPGTPQPHSLLRPHVCLRGRDFVHKLAEADGVVGGQGLQEVGWEGGKKGRE